MTRLERAIDEVQHAERTLARRLGAMAERHAVEHDVYHQGHRQETLSRARIERLAPFAEHYGTEPGGREPEGSVLETVRRKASELLGRSAASGLVLLEDLRHAYLAAQDCELCWVIVHQGAAARRDVELQRLAEQAQEEAGACARWLRTRIKTAAPQVLATG